MPNYILTNLSLESWLKSPQLILREWSIRHLNLVKLNPTFAQFELWELKVSDHVIALIILLYFEKHCFVSVTTS